MLISGLVLQAASSVISYAGFAIASLWDQEIRDDMNSIGWNPFNTNEYAALNSKKVSFYKGIPVYRINGERSGSFLAIWLSRGYTDRNGVFRPENDPNTVRHEFGHNMQQLIMNPVFYGISIGIPSYFALGPWSYYDKPWEITADILGGVNRTYNQADVNRGWWYLGVATFTGPFSYLFLL